MGFKPTIDQLRVICATHLYTSYSIHSYHRHF